MRGALCAVVLIAGPLAAQDIPPLPGSSGWGVHVLAIARAPDSAIWVGNIDQTYRFGSTMGGNFQPHQGVEFNNADGTPVHAIGDGVVVHAGPAERGALTVAIVEFRP